IIVVNWHSANYLERCLKSLYSQVREVEFEIIVIDNASSDGAAELVSQKFPRVIFIQSLNNLGFGKANNLAFESSSGNAILFLNPDTEIVESAVGLMFDHLQKYESVGAVGCRVLNTDSTVQQHY